MSEANPLFSRPRSQANQRISEQRIRICLKFGVEPCPERSEGHFKCGEGRYKACSEILETNSGSNEPMSEGEDKAKIRDWLSNLFYKLTNGLIFKDRWGGRFLSMRKTGFQRKLLGIVYRSGKIICIFHTGRRWILTPW